MSKILVIDDDPEIRILMNKFLGDQGHEVINSEDGIRVLKRLQLDQDINLIIRDLHMPQMQRDEFVKKKVRKLEHYCNIPIVMVSRSQVCTIEVN